MAKLSEKFKKENSFFLKGKNRQKLAFNEKCTRCIHDCKQSYKTIVIACPNFNSNREVQ